MVAAYAHLPDTPYNINGQRVYDLAHSSSSIAAPLREAIEVVENALRSYGADHISLSFNGGKDCTVLLHIYAAVLERYSSLYGSNGRSVTEPAMVIGSLPESSASSKPSHPSPDHPPSTVPTESSRLPSINGTSPAIKAPPIKAIYIPMPSPFSQMESFIASSTHRYNLTLFSVPCAEGESGKSGMKNALELYKAKRPEVEAILIGIRRGDPFSETLAHHSPTDEGWPQYMRIHPILEWTYAQVWQFLRDLEVPYCELYDQGYTSLGSTFNTFRNPFLRTSPPDDERSDTEERYRPAYELSDGSHERCGRGSNSMPTSGDVLG